MPHDYCNIRQILNISTLASRRDKADLDFLYAAQNCSLDIPEPFILEFLLILPEANHNFIFQLTRPLMGKITLCIACSELKT